MKVRLLLVAWLLAPGLALAARVELPEWEEETEVEAYRLGVGLFPDELMPEAEEDAGSEEVGSTGEGETANAEENATEDTPEETRESGDVDPENAEIAEETEAIEPLPPIEGALRDWYFALAPVEFLIDPQHLLTEQKSNDLRRFLEFHSDESHFHIYAMIVGETQEIPEDVSLEALHSEWFGENPVVLMVSYREKPEKTRLVYNTSVREAFGETVFDRIRQNLLREGGATENAPDQVEKMAVELSIQLYWLTKLLERQIADASGETGDSAVARAATSGVAAPQVLRQDAPALFRDEPRIRAWLRVGAQWAALLLIVLLSGITSWLAAWLWRRQMAVSGKPLLFPECEISPRLGGEFSGGGFVGMSFDLSDSGSREEAGGGFGL